MKKVKPNLSGIMLIVLGIVIIILAFMFFAVDQKNAPSQLTETKVQKIA